MRNIAAALAITALAASAAVPLAFGADSAQGTSPTLHVVAGGLNQPKKITITPDGDLLVALSGTGVGGSSCTDGSQTSCLSHTGAIDRITPSGTVTTALKDLPSLAAGTHGEATGPVQAVDAGGSLQVLFQDTAMNLKTGLPLMGAAADRLGELAEYGSRDTTEAAFGSYEAMHDPDHGAGTDVADGVESAIDSDPYAVVAYKGGYAVADAGANDILWVSPAGRISVIAVLATITERAAAHTFGAKQTKAIEAEAQAVPDGIVVGPDGALYVSELGGLPFAAGSSSVYRIVPGHAPTVYASGFTAAADLTFDRQGRLLVLEIDAKGLLDTAAKHPASGAVIEVGAHGAKTTLAEHGLHSPTGIAVTANGTVYIADDGTSTGGGEIISLGSVTG